jgi:hypothetical protein
LYFAAGKMIAYSIIHRGPKPTFFNPLMFKIISEGIDTVQPTVEDICEYDVRAKLHDVGYC